MFSEIQLNHLLHVAIETEKYTYKICNICQTITQLIAQLMSLYFPNDTRDMLSNLFLFGWMDGWLDG